MTSCRICYDLLYQDAAQTWNEPLFKTQNFVVLPSLGALVEGWLLLIPKEHFICMGALPDSIVDEMQEIKQTICSTLLKSYGQVCVFEHGPSKAKLSVGCGVDHAHLHIVPLEFDLATATTKYLPKDTNWIEAEFFACKTAFSRSEDYLYIEQPIGTSRIATHRDFGSQLFRRAIAAQIGIPNQFNWRDNPQLNNVYATIEKMRSLNSTVVSNINQLEVVT